MKRFWMAAACLLVTAALLSGCSGQPQNQKQAYDEATQYIGPAATPTAEPTDAPVADTDTSMFASNPYEVAPTDELTGFAEEDLQAEAVGTVYPYAGSTPIPMNPIDMPTPTPHGPLNFVYSTYFVQSLGTSGLTFDGPAGWIADESVAEAFTLSEPAEQMKDGQLGILSLYAVPTTQDYSLGELKSEVKQRADAIGATNFADWSPTLTAERYLMGSEGVYINFTGTMVTGIKIGGRIHATCRDKVLYVVQIIYPLEYKEDFLNVFSKVRETIKRAE